MSAQLDEIEKVRAYMLLFVKDIIDSLGVLASRRWHSSRLDVFSP